MIFMVTNIAFIEHFFEIQNFEIPASRQADLRLRKK
jgi:hypothetical protein